MLNFGLGDIFSPYDIDEYVNFFYLSLLSNSDEKCLDFEYELSILIGDNYLIPSLHMIWIVSLHSLNDSIWSKTSFMTGIGTIRLGEMLLSFMISINVSSSWFDVTLRICSEVPVYSMLNLFSGPFPLSKKISFYSCRMLPILLAELEEFVYDLWWLNFSMYSCSC